MVPFPAQGPHKVRCSVLASVPYFLANLNIEFFIVFFSLSAVPACRRQPNNFICWRRLDLTTSARPDSLHLSGYLLLRGGHVTEGGTQTSHQTSPNLPPNLTKPLPAPLRLQLLRGGHVLEGGTQTKLGNLIFWGSCAYILNMDSITQPLCCALKMYARKWAKKKKKYA